MATLAQIILAGQREPALRALELGTSARPFPEDSVGPLLAAVLQEWEDVIEALLAKGANPSETDSSGHLYALFVAVRGGNAGIVRRLIAAGADVNFRNRTEGRTALWYAAQADDAPLVELLLDAGADPGLADAAGATALDVARDGRASAAEVLERRAASASSPPQPGR
jgi:ankyrin repeat protein